MADTMQFDLVSPERRLASIEATAVRIPGADGDMTAMPDHAPVITTLRPGVVSVETTAGTDDYFVSGGFAEIGATGATVLAEAAMATSEVTREYLDSLIEAARQAEAEAKPDVLDVAVKRVADMIAVGDQLGI